MNRILTIALVSVAVLAAQLALAVDKIPDKLPNGERPWPAVPEAEVQKIQAALPDKPEVPPQKPRKLLVFYRTDGFPHSVIPEFNTMLELLGEKTGAYKATLSQSYADLQPDRLQEFDAVYFNNTCRMATPEPVKKALQDYVKSGKGFAGNHGAGDNWHDWPEGLEMIGCKFVCHPYGRIQIKVDDPQSPLTKVFDGKPFPFQDEIYAFTEPYSRAKLRVLLEHRLSQLARRGQGRGESEETGRRTGRQAQRQAVRRRRPRRPRLRHRLDSPVGPRPRLLLLARPPQRSHLGSGHRAVQPRRHPVCAGRPEGRRHAELESQVAPTR